MAPSNSVPKKIKNNILKQPSSYSTKLNHYFRNNITDKKLKNELKKRISWLIKLLGQNPNKIKIFYTFVFMKYLLSDETTQ